MRRELERLNRTVAWLVGMVGRMLSVQAGLVAAVERLERRSHPAGSGRHARTGGARLRLLRRSADMTLGMVLLALMFGVGQGLLPEGPVPPAAGAEQLDPRRVRATTSTTTTTTVPDAQAVGVTTATTRGWWGGGLGRTPVRQVTPQQQQVDAADAPMAIPPSTTSTTTSTTTTVAPTTTMSTKPPRSTVPPCKRNCDA